jgi:hypothetical protein
VPLRQDLVSESCDLGLQRCKGRLGLPDGRRQVFDFSQVDREDDFGLAAHPLAVAGVAHDLRIEAYIL